MNKVDHYIEEKASWKEELELLRKVLAQTELKEDIKWQMPTYTMAGKNVVGMAAFKNHVGLFFFKGVFLKDKRKVLVNAQENKTKGLRQWRFYALDEMDEKLILAYLKEAIENEKQGKKIKVTRSKKVSIPEELTSCFNEDRALKSAFFELTPGKQKEYAEYIATAKRDETKQKRIQKIEPMILKGIGLNDKYKNC